LANDVMDVNPSPDERERVGSIVGREPYKLHNPIVAFNADYFGDGHGPEGLTIKNGFRIDGPHSKDNDNNETRRVSLSVSRVNAVELEHKSPSEVSDPFIHRTWFYNSVGGGPLLIQDGEVIEAPCRLATENVEDSNCTETKQTAVGVSQDGQTFIIVAAESKSAEEMGEILQRYGAFTAIKLDGGSSSQLWYRGDLKIDQDGVADAILIFRENIPRHEATIVSQSEYPIVEPGEAITLTFELRNAGFLTWEPDLPYALTHTGGEDFSLETQQSLPAPIMPTGNILWELVFDAPQELGVYQTRWQMVYQDNTSGTMEPIGPEISYIITVIPEGGSLNVIDAIGLIIDQAQQEVRDRYAESQGKIQRQLEDEITQRVTQMLRCLPSVSIIIAGAIVLGWRKWYG
jgi:hypothetical protein